MKISIVTVCRNSAATIRDTLESVRNQTYPNVEHIVVDGASTDATLDIIRSYSHIGSLVSEPDRGLYDAMNKGIALAHGDLIGILNSDDVFADRTVLARVAQTIVHANAAALYGNLNYVRPAALDKTIRRWNAGAFHPNHFRMGWMPPHPTFFVRREYYQSLGTYDIDLGTAADYELMLRFLYKHRISVCYLPEVLVLMRTGGLSNRSLRQRWLANRADRQAWIKNGLQPAFYTLWLKPLRKIPQFFGCKSLPGRHCTL